MDVPKGEKEKNKTEGRWEKESSLFVQVFFQWIMYVKGRGGGAVEEHSEITKELALLNRVD